MKKLLFTLILGVSVGHLPQTLYAHPAESMRPDLSTSGRLLPPRHDGPRQFIKKHYPDARILDFDYDDGFIEIKIRHRGIEKIAVFSPEGKWLRTLWEIRRERLPQTILSSLGRIGFILKNIDDNDNRAFEDARGMNYAVQVRRGGREYVLVLSEKGNVTRRFYDDEWNDRYEKGHWYDDGEDHLDEGDDEWDDHPKKRPNRRKHKDDGEDRFDEGDDEWDDHPKKRLNRRKHKDDGEDRFDEGDDEWDDDED